MQNILMLLYNEPSLIQKIKKEELNDDIVGMLESSHYEIIDELIKLNPYIVLYMKNINEDKIISAKESGLEITIEDFNIYKNLTDYAYLFPEFLKQDPSLIRYYGKDYLNYNNEHLVTDLGYVASEEDLIFNPALCSSKSIMTAAISKDASLIRYAKEDCYLDLNFVKETLTKYQLTKEDFENNPSLVHASWLFMLLPEDLKMYSEFYDETDKINKVIECIDGKESFYILPFFNKKMGAKVSAEVAEQVCRFRLTDISDDIEVQRKLFYIFTDIIESCTNIRYRSNKRKYQFKDIVALDTKIRNVLDSLKIEELEELKRTLCNFIYPNIDFDNMCSEQDKLYSYVCEELDRFNELYDKDISINLSITSTFCNTILNRHRNRFMSNEYKKILFELSSKLELTDKKKRLIINKLKMISIRELIVNREFDKLNITEEDFERILTDTRNRILNNKKFSKKGISITNEQFDRFDELFRLNGELDISDVYDILGHIERVAAKYIVRKYNNIRLDMLNSIDDEEISECDINDEKEKLDVNPNNFIIVSEKKYKEILAFILLNVEEDILLELIEDKKLIDEINLILMFNNICNELNNETIKNIVNNYIKVREIVFGSPYSVSIVKKLDDIIILSNGYAASGDINTFLLGEDVLSKLPIGLIDRYVDVYLKSLKLKESYIPPIKFKVGNKTYRTANRWEQERLLIGRVDGYSCIDLELGGEETYLEALLDPTGSAILIRDDEQELVGRIILIRRGNTVQIVVNKNSNINSDCYTNISSQLIYKSIQQRDNLEYVVINSSALKTKFKEERMQIVDNGFVSEFPHADLDETVTVLGSSKNVVGLDDDFNFKFKSNNKAQYPMPRKQILFNPPESEVNRLLALKASLEGKSDKDFEPFYSKIYDKVIIGEDWFLGVTKTGDYVEFILPLGHTESYDEMIQVKDMLRQEKESNKASTL